MPFGAGKKIVQKNSAGLAIHDDFIYFIELDEDGQVSRKASVALPEGCIVNGSIKDIKKLEEGFKSLQKKTGKIRQPVTIGLPSGDTVIRRPLNFPRMSIEDIRSTIDLNFEEYFTSRTDTIFDAVIIKTPTDSGDKDKVSVLTVTAKKSLVDQVLEIARRADITPGSVEPMNFAMLRAVPEIKEGLCIFASPHDIVATWEGHGIFFRTVSKTGSFQDILNTIQFIGTQYRRVQVNKIILAGVDFQLSEDVRESVVSVDDPFYAAMGLALREGPENGLDLRPGEYIELERRRYSFNPNRLILWGLLSGFLMMSAGTITYAFLTIHNMNEEMVFMQDTINAQMLRRQELQKENAMLEKRRQDTERLLDFMKGDMPILEVLNAIEVNITDGIKYDNADFTRGPLGGVNVVVDGKARSDKDILTMTQGMKDSGIFDSVTIPFSTKDQLQRKVFKMVLRVKDLAGADTEDTTHGK